MGALFFLFTTAIIRDMEASNAHYTISEQKGINQCVSEGYIYKNLRIPNSRFKCLGPNHGEVCEVSGAGDISYARIDLSGYRKGWDEGPKICK